MDKEKKYPRAISTQHDENKMQPLDLTFIVNESNKTLKDRFEQLTKDCSFFDCLVAYFYVSGFNAICKALEKTEKIRILIGIGTTKQTYDLMRSAKENPQHLLQFSHSEVKQEIENIVENEMAESEDNSNVEDGVKKFIEWIESEKVTNKGLSIPEYSCKIIYNDFY